MRPNRAENQRIQAEMDKVTAELQEKGITFNTNENEMVGLGDVVEGTLQKFGITEERFKEFFGLRECNCSTRKKWLNNLFSWHAQSKK